jgi:hypothetical protein
MWKSKLELNKTGQILALVQDETGIYNQLMTVEIDKNKNQFFYTNGSLGFSHRVQDYMIKAGIYLDELCSNDIIEKYCTTKFIVKQFKFDENPIVLDTFKTRSDAINFLNKLFKKVKTKFGKYNSYKPMWITDECFQVFCCDSFRVESYIIEEE